MACTTIKELIVTSAQKYGSHDAIRYKISKNETESKTYNELKEDSERFSNVLSGLGLVGEHISLVGLTSYRWLVAFFGIVNSGSVCVPLDVALPAPELLELVNRSDSTCILVDEIRPDILAAAKASCPGLKYIISLQTPESSADILSFDEILKKENPGFDCNVSPEDLCVIMFTSGTTGKSKGVMLSHENLAGNATSFDMNLGENNVSLSVLPIHHAYCLGADILKTMDKGTTICINDNLMRVAKNIKLFQPDIMLLVPLIIETMGKQIMDAMAKGIPAAALKSEIFGDNLRYIMSGGAYLDSKYIDVFHEVGVDILQGYGMTECSPIISTNVHWDIRKDSVGKLLPDYEAKVVDGEIMVKGPSVMQGYYKMEQETKEALEPDGWLHTGDLGYIEDGYIYLTGRKKNLIITRNGENVSPEELENALSKNRIVKEIIVREHEGAIQAEIFPDAEYATNYGISDIKATIQAAIDELNAINPPYKRIVSLIVRDEEFPKTTSKKIKR